MSVLVGSAAFIGWLSEILVGSTEEAIKGVGLSEVFVGVIVVPIIGNAAEHSSLAVAVASSVVRDAESHWLEGAFSCSSTPC